MSERIQSGRIQKTWATWGSRAWTFSCDIQVCGRLDPSRTRSLSPYDSMLSPT